MTAFSWKKLVGWSVFIGFLSLFLSSLVQGAQSSSDAVADSKMKEQVRRQIVGDGTVASNKQYIVGYRDILHVSIYGEGSMAIADGVQAEAPGVAAGGAAAVDFIRGRGSGIEVRLDGRISLRHIGDVAVVGMNLTQIADYLKQLYATIYDDPVLTVTLVQSNSMQYTVMGQVINPGLFHLDFPITVIRAVARAGGFTEWANSSVTIIRSNSKGMKGEKAAGDKGKTFKFDFDDFLKGRDIDKNILIQSGDVIVVH